MHRLISAAVLCTAAAAFAQAPGEEAIFRADTRLVVLHASVVDKSGKLVTNLAQHAFKVYENGAEQSIKIFKREDVPVSMGILSFRKHTRQRYLWSRKMK